MLMDAGTTHSKVDLDTLDQVSAALCLKGAIHDLNNYLGAIMSQAELLGLKTDEGSREKEMVDGILVAVRKGNDLLEALALSVKDSYVTDATVDLGAMASSVIGLHRHALKRAGIAMETTLPDGPVEVLIDRGALFRLLMVLMRDTIDSLAEASKGRIHVRIAQINAEAVLTIVRSPEPAAGSDAGPMFIRAKEIASVLGLTLRHDPQVGSVLVIPCESMA